MIAPKHEIESREFFIFFNIFIEKEKNAKNVAIKNADIYNLWMGIEGRPTRSRKEFFLEPHVCLFVWLDVMWAITSGWNKHERHMHYGNYNTMK